MGLSLVLIVRGARPTRKSVLLEWISDRIAAGAEGVKQRVLRRGHAATAGGRS
jgi:hypothetical protein